MSKALDPKDTCVLVTGGAGFIGSHTVVQLLEGGYQVVIVDDLSNSSAVAVDRVKTIVGDEAAKNLTFYEANVLDRDAMNKIFDTHQIDRVIHFAGFKAVGESVSKPVEYYHNNIENTLVLIDVMRNHGCKSIIFSSSSTVYGDPDNPPVTEEDPKKPATNPYGWTKWMIEQILMDVHTADPEWDVVLLRYFNPIGAHPSGLIGEDPKGIPNNLVPYVAQVAVGKLERFVGDWKLEHGAPVQPAAVRNGRKVAVIGSGPAGLACASDLARMGYEVKIFEALHKVGGVLVYGIPEFRLPKERIVAREIAQVERLGVGIETDVIVGRTVTIDSLLDDEGYDAVFIGSGAGLPRFMGIPGENLNGVVSANEFLTRANLMHAYDKAYDTPIYVGQRVVVVGGGNVAMDAVRTAKRLGAEATIVYRRSEKELPARVEEVHHAKEEGIRFRMLTNPTEVLGDEKGWVTGLRCVEMELGEPDESGRRSPVVKEGSEFEIECDVVIMALGTSPNPLLAATTAGLETTRRGCITADERGATTRPGVFAGGDAVTGAATVILAMGAGRTAAKAIDEYIKSR